MNKPNLPIRIILTLALITNTFGINPGAAFAANYNSPGGMPDYLGGVYPNYANSPVIRKFVDSLPGVGFANRNNLGQYIPIASADTATYPGSDYYEIGLSDYSEQMHSDLPPTKLRGYKDLRATGTDALNHFLGPLIIAKKNRPVRIKFTNMLGTGTDGDLFIPVDTTMMGAGMGPDGMNSYTQNRATIHLHGGDAPWISDGTPHQWITPAGEMTMYPKGVSFQNVPDMIGPGKSIPDPNDSDGMGTFYYPNGLSSRFMFYHDHAYGMTRLNVYAGEAAGYLIVDPTEESLINTGILPDQGTPQGVYRYGIPLVIQDKTFVDAPNIPIQDPTWNWGTTPPTPNTGDLWYPHVYMPNQNPNDLSGANAMGRWDYGPWFWPVFSMVNHGPATDPVTGQVIPGTPDNSSTMEAFMDTPMVNGTAYPYIPVGRKAYRFRVLNASNDRTLNLQLYFADTGGGGQGAQAMASVTNGVITGLTLINGGSGYAMPPYVNIADVTGTNATATATVAGGVVTGITLTNGGSGYSSVPTITFSSGGPGGTGAQATATVVGGAVTSIAIANGGSGYTSAPGVYLVGGGGTGAIMKATVVGGAVNSITVVNGGAGYTSIPAVVIGGNTEVKMVPALPNSGLPATWPVDGRDGGVPDPTTAGPKMIQIGTEGGFLAAPAVRDNTPVGYEYNRKNIVVLNVSKTTLCLVPAERADVIIDFSQVPDGTNVILYNDAPAAMPAFDPRNDYYTGNPDQSYATGNATGGAPSTLPGYGPNTRTIMQFRVTSAIGAAPAFDLNKLRTAWPAAYAAQQPAPIVPQTTYPAPFAAATDTYSKIQDTSLSFVPSLNALGNITLVNGGSGYTTPPAVRITGGGGTGAAATTTITRGVNAINIANAGSGYTTAPIVTLTGGGGTGAAATAIIGNGRVISIALTNGGSGYTAAPTVTFTGGGGTGAAATATISSSITGITLISGGTSYTIPPTVRFIGGGGTGAAATATVNGIVNTISMLNFGRLYTSVPTVTITGGGGTGATATARISGGRVVSITITNKGTGYISVPTVTITGGGGTGAAARAAIVRSVTNVTITNGGTGYTTTPTITFSGGGGIGARATATLGNGIVTRLTLTNGGTGYTTPPTVALIGGGGTGASASIVMQYSVTGFTITNGGSGYTTAPIVTLTGGAGTGATATASITGIVNSITLTNGGSGYTTAPIVTFLGGGGIGATATASILRTTAMEPKAIQELFELDYGRMNATLGVEMPFTNSQNQTTIPYGYIDPPTEILKPDQAQIWKITHNGVDTHAIHFHLFNVQVINRVGWDGAIRPPEPNEVGWKETVRMNPLEDCIVALKPITPTIPFNIPDSVRPLNPTMPLGATAGFFGMNPQGLPIVVTNDLTNFGWEYVWHCHMLDHEEMDMMRPMIFQAISVPGAPTGVNAIEGNGRATVSFTAPFSSGTSPIASYTVTSNPGNRTATGATSPIIVTGLTNGTAYTFRVTATSAVGTGPLSSISNSVTPGTLTAPGAPMGVTASAGNAKATVSFTAPVSNGSPITSYTVTANTGLITTGTSSPITVTGLTNGTAYTFRVTATNAFGTGPAATSNSITPSLTAIPGAPLTVTATPGNTTATVSFAAPVSDGGSPITGYTITSNPGNITAIGTMNPITITGLTNGTAYTFTVTATNANGTGPTSGPSNSVTPAASPNTPTGVTAVGGNTQASISFTAPASNGSTITSYTVASNPGNITATGTASPITVTGLTNGTVYTFTVKATSNLGASPMSSPSNTIIPVAVPDAPTGVTAVGGNAQAIISFTAPASGGSAITSYTVASNPGNITATGTASPITVTGLTNGTSYTFTVTATSAVGTSLASAASAPATPMTIPGAPTGVTATGGNTTATISFTPPTSNGGSPIIVYLVTSTPGNITAIGATSPIIVAGLTNGTTYTFTVIAVNAVGSSLVSAPSASIKLATAPPGAPTGVTAIGGNAQATVSFTPPISDGGSPVTSYTVTSNPGNITATGAASPITVTGLTNGTAYTFTLTATNVIGTSPASTASLPVTPATVPGAPTGVTATGGSTQATVIFTAPVSNGGSPVTSYTVTSNPGNITATGAASPITVTGLTNGTSYTFTVTAVNIVGSGTASAPSSSIIPNILPGAPTGVTAVGGNAQATVSFTPPVSNGNTPITFYTVTSTPGNITASGAAGPITVTGLTNGTSYTFTVTATNSLGTGPASTVSNIIIPSAVTIPGAPTGVIAVPGNTQATVSFTAPVSNGGSPITSYTVTSTPGNLTAAGITGPITVTGLTNGTSYTFTVTATNAIGISAASAPSTAVTPATVPGTPTIGTATGGNTQAIVSFTAPASDGGSPITGYTVTSSPGGITATGAASPITVTGLTNGTSYTFTVTATNAIGISAASGPSNIIIPVAVPDAPTGVSAIPGNAQATISFSTPAANGSPITGYTVTASPGGTTATGAASPITITGLTNGITYTFTVTATNAIGTSAASAPSTAVTPATVPGAPTIGAITAGNAQATVNFNPPASDGGSPITLYTVTSNPGNITATGTTSPITITGLANGVSYTFTVTATNAIGTSLPSTLYTPVTPATIPGAPSGVTATQGNTQATVTFTAPSNGGSPITSYTVTSTPGNLTTTGSASPIIVTGLTNGTSYTFTVTATNSLGTGPTSAASTAITPATVPGAPTGVTAVGGNARATVSFSVPTSDGGSPITGYTVTSNPGNFTATGTSSPITVTGLTNGTSYSFTVTANNLIGTSALSLPTLSVIPVTVPTAPTGVTAIGGNNQATVSFSPPASDGGSPITLYTVISQPGNTAATGVTSPITINGLVNGNSYTFTVIATNGVGISPASAASAAVTPDTAPPAPTGFMATGQRNTVNPAIDTVVLSWSENATTLQGFTIQRANDSNFTMGLTTFTVGAGVTTYTDNGLNRRSNYFYRIQAYNGSGNSTWSYTSILTP